MKISIVILFICTFNLVAGNVHSQNEKLSLKVTNTTIEGAIAKIEKDNGYVFIYNEDVVPELKKQTSLQSKSESIGDVLDKLFSETDLAYSVTGKQVVVYKKNDTKKELTTISPAVQPEQQNQQTGKTITGKVVDAKGEPVIGATIVVQGNAAKGTVTDIDGNYILTNVPEDAVLDISYVGMKSQSIASNGRTAVNITLLEDTELLEEVVVVGYGTQKRVNLTGAVGQVTSKVLDNRAIQNVGQGLQGTIANLNIVTNPGDPGKIGQGSSYQIRGQGSINGGGPLILIDGVQGDLNQVNPNDIDNISVLKDAASASIYGARATFGVILVTTKSGKQGQINVSINSSVSNNSITNFPKVVNSLKYAEVMNVASKNAGIADYFGQEQIERIKKYMDNPGSIPTTVPEPGDPSKWSYALGNDNINYMKIYYKDHMFSQKHDVAISGGSDKVDYRFSLGYLDQNGVYAFGQDVFERYNILANVNTKLTKWLSFKFQSMLNMGTTNEPYEYAGSMGNYFHTAYTRQPHWPFYDPNGNPMWTSQKQFFEGARRNTKDNELKFVGEAIIQPVKEWSLNARVSYNKQLEEGTAHEAKLYAWNVDGTPYTLYGNSSFTKSYLARDYKNTELFTTIDKQLGLHNLSGLLGTQLESYYASSVGGYVPNLVSDDVPSLNTGTGKKNTWDGIDEWVNLGYFGRFNYNFAEKYLLEINARYDGTSKFPKGKRWGFFPSISTGWNISKEKFFDIQEIDLLKLRASYGYLGNQQISNYLFFSRVPIYSNLGWLINSDRPNYIGTPGLISDNLTWATAKTTDFGLDIQALNNRLDLSFDWYVRNTTDMIGPANALPAVLGASVPQTNNADMKTTGFELTVGWRGLLSNEFSYNVKLTLADYISEITKYNNPNKLLSTYYEGQKLGEIWGYETVGIIQTEEQLQNMADQREYINSNPWHIGDIEYRDLNKDGKISPGDRTYNNPGDLKVIGNNTPRYSFGFSFGFDWKNFDFNMFGQGILKRDVWLGDIPFFGITGSWTQQIYKTTTNYWSDSNKDAYFARPYASGETTKNQLVQTRFLQNAAYARLKNIQLGYTLPKTISNVAKLQKVRVYLNGENLFYFSAIDENFDPERVGGSWGSGKTYPLFKTYTAGINVTF